DPALADDRAAPRGLRQGRDLEPTLVVGDADRLRTRGRVRSRPDRLEGDAEAGDRLAVHQDPPRDRGEDEILGPASGQRPQAGQGQQEARSEAAAHGEAPSGSGRSDSLVETESERISAEDLAAPDRG